MNSTTGLSQWANDNMALLIIGLVVVLAASVLITRALRRAKAVRDGLTVEQRDARARRIEDGLTVAVAMVASGLSLTGLWHYAQDILHLPGPWRVLPYFGLDAAVIVCAIRARRRARNNEAAGWNGRLVWIFAVISAVFGFSEGGSLWGGFGRAVWPLIAATLFELGLIEQRHAAQRDVRRRLNLGWAHPIERLRVYAALSADSTLTADDATHEVRVNAAARALYRLRHADTAAENGRGLARAKLRRVEHRTQRALLRANFSDPQVTAEVLQRTQALVRTRDFARMDYSALDDARAMLTDAIDHTVLPANKRSRPARRTAPETAPKPTATAPATDRSAPATAPATAPAAAPSAPEPATGRHAAPPEQTAPATAPQSAPRTDPEPEEQKTGSRSGPRRSAGPARRLIGFTWERSDADLTAKPGTEWKAAAREYVRSVWESDPAAVNAAAIRRELAPEVTEAPVRKLVSASVKELEAWPHWESLDGAGGAEETTEQEPAADPAADVDRSALRRELHAADPGDTDDDTAAEQVEVEDKQPAHVA